MSSYFRHHLVPVMTQTQSYLTEKQGEEMKAYSTSLGGILGMMASAGQPLADPYQTLKVTGEWNSKTTEDYIGMCKDRILSSEEMQHDLAYMAGQWRDVVVKEVGRERYDKLSQELGCDLAYAFVDYRVEQLMIDQLVKERMPKSSADYIIRKAAESSLLGLPQALGRSPLAEEIEKRGEVAYRPSKLEKGAGFSASPTPSPRYGFVDGRCTVHRCGYGNLSRCRPFREGGNAAALCRGVYQQGRVRQRQQRVRQLPQRGGKHTGQRKHGSCRSQRKVAKEDTDCNIRFYGLVENRQ